MQELFLKLAKNKNQSDKVFEWKTTYKSSYIFSKNKILVFKIQNVSIYCFSSTFFKKPKLFSSSALYLKYSGNLNQYSITDKNKSTENMFFK